MKKTFSDLLRMWPEEKLLNYLKEIKKRCDNDSEFEKFFFENYFQTILDSEAISIEKLFDIFEIVLEEGDCEKDGCGLEDNSEDDDQSDQALEFLRQVINNRLEANNEDDYDDDENELINRVSYPEIKKLDVIGNNSGTLNVTMNYKGELTVECTQKNPFYKKFITHVVTFPPTFDLSTVSVTVNDGIAHLHIDSRKESWKIDVTQV